MQNTTLLSTNTLVVSFVLDIDEYLSKRPDEYDEYFIRLLRQAINDYDNKYDLPSEIIDSGIQKFEDSQFINEWQLAKKRIKFNKNLYCSTQCKIDFDKFSITMKIEDRNGILIDSCEIYSEAPDVFVFGYYMTKYFIQYGDELIFTDKLGNPFFAYKIPGSLAGS